MDANGTFETRRVRPTVSRRRLVALGGTGLIALLAACAAPATPTPAPAAPAVKPAAPATEAPKPASEAPKPAAEAPKPAAAVATKPAGVAAPAAEPAKPTTAPAAPAPAAQAVAGGRQIELMIWANVTPGEQARAAHVTQVHPNIKTSVASQGTGGQGAEAVQKFLTAIAAGTAAPVVFFDRFQISSYGHRNAFMPLDDRIKGDNFDLKRFSDATIRECYGIDGKLYGLPRHFVDRYYMINADHFKEIGVDRVRHSSVVQVGRRGAGWRVIG